VRAAAARITAFRIVKRKFAPTAFSGTGARLYGGRWNSPGSSVVYVAGSLSLALLEWRVHLSQWPPPPIVVIPVRFDFTVIWAPKRFPVGWNRYPATRAAAGFGDNWVRAARSAVLRVPSAIVPGEWNYLLNPNHADFQLISIGKPSVLRPDQRLGPLGTPRP